MPKKGTVGSCTFDPVIKPMKHLIRCAFDDSVFEHKDNKLSYIVDGIGTGIITH